MRTYHESYEEIIDLIQDYVDICGDLEKNDSNPNKEECDKNESKSL